MKVEAFLERIPSDFFTGVPDSQLKALCDALMERYGISERHIIAANEGNAVALATGHFLASGEVPTVYLQNSGEGNAMNPLASLCAKGVYAIPLLLVIGYRGEPGGKDEPQHLFQGEITLSFLDMMEIPYFILEKETTEEELTDAMRGFAAVFREGRQAAIVVKKGALENKKAFMQSLKD
jgi:phosphonopyruvate decarboxylase